MPLSHEYVQEERTADTILKFEISPGLQSHVALMAVGISPKKLWITKTGGVIKGNYIS